MEAINVYPQDIYILNIPSIDRYKVPPLAISLNFRDTFTVRLGAEYAFARFPLALRAGYIFESGAAAGSQMSVMAIDNHKHLLTLGLGYTVAGYRLDAMFARSFSGASVVDFRESSAMQINPINPKGAVGVGGGSYRSAYSLIGLGVSKSFPW
jgi:long-subunit fatty acid transport protein